MKKVSLLLLALVVSGLVYGGDVPPDVAKIQTAATHAGLLTDADFSSHEPLDPANLKRRRDQLASPQIKHTMDLEPYVEETLLRNYPFTIGVHKPSGFGLTTYFSEQQVMLLTANVPLVNGEEKEQAEMIETMIASAEALLPNDKGLRKWLDSAWQDSWKESAKWMDGPDAQQKARDHPDLVAKEVIKKRQVGSYLVIVWGVPPDIVFLNCVRVPDPKTNP
jgi:hypothetical protein